jgi:hypothetical protein
LAATKVVHMANENPQLVTIEELSKRSRLSIATIHRLKKAGKIPFFQPSGIGGRLLFPLDAIERSAATTVCSATPAAKVAPPPRLSGPTPDWRKRR